MKDKTPTVKYKRKTIKKDSWRTSGGRMLAFGMDQQMAIDDPVIKKQGRQNKRKGTIYRRLKKISKVSKKRNR